MAPKEYIVDGGARIFLGKNSKNNDELVLEFKDKLNVIFHTAQQLEDLSWRHLWTLTTKKA